MKIKIKHFQLLSAPQIIVFSLLLVGFLGAFAPAGFSSVSAFWGDFLSYVQQRNMLYYWFFKFFPWLVFAGAILFVWNFLVLRQKHQKKGSILFLNFTQSGVFLTRKGMEQDIFLPYGQTQLSVCIRTTLTYHAKSRRYLWTFGGYDLTFTQEGNSFSVRHMAGLSFLQTILDEGQKFHSFQATVLPLQEDQSLRTEEQDFIRFLETQIENHRQYGLVEPDFPQNRFARLIYGVGPLLVIGLLSLPCRLLLKTNNWMLITLLGILCLILLKISVENFRLLFKGLQTAKRLRDRKKAAGYKE